MKNYKLDVVEVASLDENHAKNFVKPWLTVAPDGETVEHETEDAACLFQIKNGFDDASIS